MKRILTIISGAVVIIALSKNQIKDFAQKYINSDTVIVTENVVVEIDTAMKNSMMNIQSVGETFIRSDSVINKRVEKTVKKIEKLNHTVNVLKKENSELRARLNDTDVVNGHFGLLPITDESD